MEASGRTRREWKDGKANKMCRFIRETYGARDTKYKLNVLCHCAERIYLSNGIINSGNNNKKMRVAFASNFLLLLAAPVSAQSKILCG